MHLSKLFDSFKSAIYRLVEEVKQNCSVNLENEDVYMNTVFDDFANCVIKRSRGIEDKEPFEFDAVSKYIY